MSRVSFNRFKVSPPDPDALSTYFLDYPPKQLYRNPSSLSPISSPALFHNLSPLILDLGCGRGEYSLALGLAFPTANIIGLDCHKKSLFDAVNQVNTQLIPNLKFIRSDLRFVLSLVPDASIDHIALLFPPPPTKTGLLKSHFFNTEFVNQITRILKPSGTIVFASDNSQYFSEKKELLSSSPSLHLVSQIPYFLPINTRFSNLWAKKGISPETVFLQKA